jgi:fluoroquinolone resistance protein
MGFPADNLFGTDEVFVEQTFDDLMGEGLSVAGKEFQRCLFRRCKLPQSRWPEARLEDCVFEDCDLTRMAPQALACRGVIFKGSKLMGVEWSGLGALPDLAFDGCDLRYASFVDLRLRALKLIGCLAREANFLGVDLTEADFSGSDLTGSTISGCTLAKANFSGASGVFFDPQKNKCKGARVAVETAVSLMQSYGVLVE